MKRKKLFAAAAVLVIAAMISGVAAWLSDGETTTDVITAGQVSISLRESKWRAENASDVHPQDILPKNPTVTNIGTSDAYVFIKVSMAALKAGTQIADEEALMELTAPTPLYTTRSGSREFDDENWQRLIGPVYDAAHNAISWVYSYSKKGAMTALTPGATTSELFDSVQLANVQRRSDVEKLDANLYVTAYAIQTTELGSTGNASTAGAVWSIVSNANKVSVATETLPLTTPRIVRVFPTPTPTPKPGKATPKPTSNGLEAFTKTIKPTATKKPSSVG